MFNRKGSNSDARARDLIEDSLIEESAYYDDTNSDSDNDYNLPTIVNVYDRSPVEEPANSFDSNNQPEKIDHTDYEALAREKEQQEFLAQVTEKVFSNSVFNKKPLRNIDRRHDAANSDKVASKANRLRENKEDQNKSTFLTQHFFKSNGHQKTYGKNFLSHDLTEAMDEARSSVSSKCPAPETDADIDAEAKEYLYLRPGV